MFEDEHRGPSHPETNSEVAFRIHWIALGILAAVGCGGNIPLVFGAVAALSVIGFALLIANRDTYEGSMRALFYRASGWLLPVWVAVGTLAVGLLYPAYRPVNQGAIRFWEMLPLPPSWVPVLGPIRYAGLDVILSIGIFATALNAVLLCKSRLVFARTWAALVIGAGVLALLGILQLVGGAQQIIWVLPIQNPHFFSTFPHPAHWSAFALLWMSAALGLLGWLVRQRGWRWLSGEGWIFLLVAALLGVSIAMAGDPLYQLLAAAVGGLGCLVIAWQTRQERLKAGRRGTGFPLLVWAAAGVALFGLAAQIAIHYPLDEWIKYAGDGSGAAMHERVIEDTQSMWRARKWFGWGPASFRVVYSFYQGIDQGGAYYAYARSDFWQSLAEHGVIGTAAWCAPALWMLARLVWQRRLAVFLIAPLAGIAAIAALSVVDFPFASPAVFFAFWLMLFSIGRWSEVDKEDTTSAPSERRRVDKLRAEGHTLAPVPATAPTPPATSPGES